MQLFKLMFLVLAWSSLSEGLGLTIPAVPSGNKKKLSSLDNLQNCVSYVTSSEEVVIIRVSSGSKIHSQVLNLHVFDSENNLIRSSDDIEGESDLIFTNFENPHQLDNNGNSVRHGILNKIPSMVQKLDSRKHSFVAKSNGNLGKSFIHVCFDNLYHDRSWSFHAEPREVEIEVDIKNMKTIKETNYKAYAQHFRKFKMENSDTNNNFGLVEDDLSKAEFEKYIQILESELYESELIIQTTEDLLKNLMDIEFQLRDTNESIFESFTFNSIVLLSTIGTVGLFQLIYFRCFLKKSKII